MAATLVEADGRSAWGVLFNNPNKGGKQDFSEFATPDGAVGRAQSMDRNNNPVAVLAKIGKDGTVVSYRPLNDTEVTQAKAILSRVANEALTRSRSQH